MPSLFCPFVASLVFGVAWGLGRLNPQFLSSTLSWVGTDFVRDKPLTLAHSGWRTTLFPASLPNLSAMGY